MTFADESAPYIRSCESFSHSRERDLDSVTARESRRVSRQWEAAPNVWARHVTRRARYKSSPSIRRFQPVGGAEKSRAGTRAQEFPIN